MRLFIVSFLACFLFAAPLSYAQTSGGIDDAIESGDPGQILDAMEQNEQTLGAGGSGSQGGDVLSNSSAEIDGAIGSINSTMAAVNQQITAATAQVEGQIANATAEIERLQGELASATEREKQQIRRQIETLKSQVTAMQNQLKQNVLNALPMDKLMAMADMINNAMAAINALKNIDIMKIFQDMMSSVVSQAMSEIMQEATQAVMGAGAAATQGLPAIAQPELKRWVKTIKEHADAQQADLDEQKEWLTEDLAGKNVTPAMTMMADQQTVAAVQQGNMIGMFFDARQHMDAQRSIQKIRARAHKDYQPSAGMCEFGSTTKSLAASERNAEVTSLFLARRSQDRALGKDGTAGATGNTRDKASRLKQFREKFCDPADNDNGLAYICDHDQKAGGKAGATDKERMNKDIDYARTLDAPWTLKLDFKDSKLTHEEEEVLALATNLYGDHVFYRPDPDALAPLEGAENDLREQQRLYMDMRALLAKRSVAENSFNAMTAMKSEGSEGSEDYLEAVLEGLGVSSTGDDPETIKMLGEKPSYYAQMEILTKKLYQNPEFYTNLYDKPANVARKEVALQAIGLMQKFDLFKSYLRQEASLSVLLELAVTDLQADVEDQLPKRLK